jgi:hypothetical protein
MLNNQLLNLSCEEINQYLRGELFIVIDSILVYT